MKNLNNWVDTTPTLSLESQMNQLALEAGFLTNLSQGLKKIIPSLLEKIRGATDMVDHAAEADTASQPVSNANLTPRQKEAIQKVRALDFLVFAQMPVQVPENFKGKIHDYIVTLNSLSPKVYSGVITLLGEYNAILSSFINNSEMQTGLKTHQALFRGIQGTRAQREKLIKHFFPKIDGKSKQPLKEIVARSSDLPSLFQDTNKLRTDHKKQNLQQINAAVQQSVDMLGIILKNLQEHKDSKVGPEATMDVASGAYEVAKEVEHLAAFHYQVITALASVEAISSLILDN